MFGVADESALGDFEDEALEGEVCMFGGEADVFWKAEVGQLSQGDVDRESEMVRNVFGRGEDGTKKLASKQAMKAGLFSERNELIWLDQATLRMLPAGERLEAAEEAGAELDERLEIRNDLVIFECSPQIVCVVGSHARDDTTVSPRLTP